MPLIEDCSEEARKRNIAELIRTGHSQEQAVAIVADMCGDKPRAKSYYMGTTVKSLGGGRIGGYLIAWGTPRTLDLQGEYFTQETELNLDWYDQRPVLYHHGLDGTLKSVAVGRIDTLRKDEIGAWAEAQLDLRNEYIRAIQRLIDEGALAWSSGSSPHLVKVGDDGHIKRWPIIEGSLTPTPAMPFGTEIMNMKTFLGLVKGAERKEPDENDQRIDEDTPTIQAKDKSQANIPGGKNMGKGMKQTTKERIMALLDELSKELAAILVDEVALEAEVEMTEEEAAPVVEEVATAIQEVVEEAGIIEEVTEVEEAKAEDEELDEEEMRNKMMALIRANLAKVIPDSLRDPIRKQEQRQARAKSFARELVRDVRDGVHVSVKKGRGGFQANALAQAGKAKRPGLVTFLKCAYERDFTEFYGKAQNPYIGDRGGFLLGQELSNEILPELRAEIVMFNAGVKQTNVAQGTGSITVPKMTTAPTAYRPGINQPIASEDAQFDQVTAFLRPIAAIATIPFQLIQQSPLAVEQTIRDELIKSIALQVDIEILEGVSAVVGSNTGAQINGVLTVLENDPILSSTNIVTLGTGDGRQPKFSDLTDAETQIANGNVSDMMPKSWVMNARSRGRFRSLETTTGEPLLRDNFGNEPFSRLMGYPLWVGNQITNNKTTGTSSDTTEIYYGAWGMSEYFMQDQMEIIVDSITLADQLQMRIIAYTYSDFIVHYPEAFYVMKGVR